MSNISLDKLRGFLIGVFLGDALGAPHEFRYQTDVYDGTLKYKSKMLLRSGTKYMAVGQVTDDSEMTITLLRRMLEDGGDVEQDKGVKYIRDNVILEYIEWSNSKPGGMGINTRYLLAGITAKDRNRRLNTYNNRYNSKKVVTRYKKEEKRGFGWPESDWSQSNGCLMRCSPLVLLDDLSAVDIDCGITNPHQVNKVINKLYIVMLKNAIMNIAPVESFNIVINMVSNKDMMSVFGSIPTSVIEVLSQISLDYQKYTKTGDISMCLSRDVKVCKGWALHSFYVAVMAFLIFDTLEEGLNWVISLSGDTDTNAAIAGALIGGRLGYDKIKEESTTANNIEILLNCDTEKGDFPRDKKYMVNDFMELTLNIYNRIN